jgi:hypothetical protein
MASADAAISLLVEAKNLVSLIKHSAIRCGSLRIFSASEDRVSFNSEREIGIRVKVRTKRSGLSLATKLGHSWHHGNLSFLISAPT